MKKFAPTLALSALDLALAVLAIVLSVVILAASTLAVAAADAAFPPSKPAGWQGVAKAPYLCDPERFTPVLSEDGTRVLYWNNPTCQSPEGDLAEDDTETPPFGPKNG